MDLNSLMELAGKRPLTGDELAHLNTVKAGLSGYLGIELTYLSADQARGRLVVTENHLQPAGLVNGGVYCAIGETLGSIAGLVAAGRPVVGITNTTNFLSSCGLGSTIEAVANPVHLGSSTQSWEIECFDSGKLLAKTALRTMVLR